MATHEPVPFAVRLRHTIYLLKWETDQGIEDWTETITALTAVLEDEDASAVINNIVFMEPENEENTDEEDWDDDEF